MSEPNIHRPRSRARGPEFAEALPPSDVLERETIQTMTHQVWINRQYICSTDRDYLADMVSRAINHWRLTEDGKKWWSERQKADNEIIFSPLRPRVL